MKPIKRASCPTCKNVIDTENVKADKSGVSLTLKCKRDGTPLRISDQWYVRATVNDKRTYVPCGVLKKDAEAYIAKFTLARHTGVPLPQREAPIYWHDAVKLYTDHNIKRTKESSQTFYKFCLLALEQTFSTIPLQKITSSLVTEYMAERNKVASNVTVNHELGTLKRVLSIAVKTYCDSDEDNDCPALEKAHRRVSRIDPLPVVAKDRVLSMSEIKTLWSYLPKLNISIANTLKLILLTGQRPGEVAGICPEEIEGSWWTIPKDRSKNGVPNRVYMTTTALDLASGIHVHRASVSRAILRSIDDLGIGKFTPHDLRRTMATRCSEMGFSDSIIDAVLNHTKQGIIKVYNRNSYDKEKQEIITAWENKVLDFVSGETGRVIELRKAA